MNVSTFVTLHTAFGRLAALDLTTLQSALASHFALMILVNADEQMFRPFDLTEAADTGRWRDGRAFGPSIELRWRHKGDGYAVCLATEDDVPSGSLSRKEEGQFQRTSLDIRLWGEYDAAYAAQTHADVWIEGQIPRLLDYPIGGAPLQVALRVMQYWRSNGNLAFVRFAEIVDWNGGLS